MTRLFPIGVLILLAGCSPHIHRGEFSLLSTSYLGGEYELLSDRAVTGSACFGVAPSVLFMADDVFSRAVHKALEEHPSATLLADAELVDRGACVSVTGLPAKLR